MKRKNIGHWKIKEEMRNMHCKEKKTIILDKMLYPAFCWVILIREDEIFLNIVMKTFIHTA